MATLSKVTAAASLGAGAAHVGVAAADAAAKQSASIWAIVVLGIPLGVLAAALAASAIRHLRKPAAPDRRLVSEVISTIADGFIGGWMAMLLIGLPATREHIGQAVLPEVIGAACALLVQFVRDYGKGYWDRLYDALLSRFFGGGRIGGGS